jgi:hypothetical protein
MMWLAHRSLAASGAVRVRSTPGLGSRFESMLPDWDQPGIGRSS